MTDYNYLDSPLSLRGTVRLLARKKKTVTAIFFGMMAVLTVATLLIPTQYRATSKILIELDKNSERALLFKLANWDSRLDYDRIATEMEILGNRSVLEKVVDKYHRFLVRTDPKDKAESERERLIVRLENGLKIERSRNTNVLQVAFEDENPEIAAQIVNAMVKTYIQYRAELFKNTQAYQFFDDQIKMIEAKLNQLESAQARFRQQQRISEPENQALIFLQKIGDFEKSFTQVRTERIGKEARLKVIKAQLGQKNPEIIIPATESSNSPSREAYLSGLKSKLAELEIERGALLTRFTPAYYGVIKKSTEIDIVKEKIKAEVGQVIEEEETGLKSLRAEENEYNRKINELNLELQNLMADKFEIEKLSRGVADNRELYSMLLKQREDARISQSKQDQVVQVRILNLAVIPFRPAAPNRRLILLIGLLFSAFSSVIVTTLVDSCQRAITSVEDVQNCLDLPVLPMLPEFHSMPAANPVAQPSTGQTASEWLNPALTWT